MEQCLSTQRVPQAGTLQLHRSSFRGTCVPLTQTPPLQHRPHKQVHLRTKASFTPPRPSPVTLPAPVGARKQPSHVCHVTVIGRNEEVPVDGEECEVVHGADVVLGQGPPGAQTMPVKADDRTAFKGYMVVPLKNRNGTGVLMLPDVTGCTSQANREFAHRLACFGYTILVPDLFRGTPWEDSMPKDEYEQWRAMHAQPAKRVAQDIDTAAEFLRARIEQTDGLKGDVAPRLALIGFCFGGGRVLEVLAKDGKEGAERFLTGVSFYGTRFNASEVANDIKVPVLMIVGEQDDLCEVDEFSKVGDKVAGSEVLVYPERGHGFVHRPQSMDEDEDAENAFQVARHWLHKHLLIESSFE